MREEHYKADRSAIYSRATDGLIDRELTFLFKHDSNDERSARTSQLGWQADYARRGLITEDKSYYHQALHDKRERIITVPKWQRVGQ